MFLLSEYAMEYARDVRMTPSEFPVVMQQRGHLFKGLNKENAPWSREVLLSVMKRLCKAKDGFILYEPLCKEIGERVVDAMIEANLIHLRPGTTFSSDLENVPG